MGRLTAPKRYRIAVFGEPRTPWRDTAAAAMTDAIKAKLASWDGEAREYFLAIPVAMESGPAEDQTPAWP